MEAEALRLATELGIHGAAKEVGIPWQMVIRWAGRSVQKRSKRKSPRGRRSMSGLTRTSSGGQQIPKREMQISGEDPGIWRKIYSMMRDPYDVLGISPSASEEEIKTIYRTLAKKYYPDSNPGDTEAAGRMNRDLNPDQQERFRDLTSTYALDKDASKYSKRGNCQSV